MIKIKRNLYGVFLSNYFLSIIITVISILIFVSYFATMFLGNFGNEINFDNPNDIAKSIVKSNYKDISIKQLEPYGGWVEIVDDNRVIYVIGEKKDSVYEYGIKEIKNYLSNNNKDSYDIGFENFKGKDGKEYTCVVKLPTYLKNPKYMDATTSYIIQGFIISITFFIFFNGLVIYLSIRKIGRSLRNISTGLNSMKEGNYKTRLNFTSVKEIEDIRDSFNLMVDELEQTKIENEKIKKSKNDLIRDLSHDIKTPVTSIIGYSKLLIDEEIPKEKRDTYLNYIYEKGLRVNYLINNLFAFSKIDNLEHTLNIKKHDFIDFIQNSISFYYPEMMKKDIELEMDIPDKKIIVEFDYNELTRAVGNLIINAIKYNPCKTKIYVGIEELEKSIILTIKDYGVGIKKEFEKKIFKEFYRGSSDRNSDGGSGLGLAIVKKIVQLHKGTINLDSIEGEYTKFTVKINKRYKGEEYDT